MSTIWACRRLLPRLVDETGDAAVAAHLAACAPCRTAAAELEAMASALRAETPALEESFWTSQRAAILARVDALPTRTPRRRGFGAIAALALAASLLAGILLRPRPVEIGPLDPPMAAALAEVLGVDLADGSAAAGPLRVEELSDGELLALWRLMGDGA